MKMSGEVFEIIRHVVVTNDLWSSHKNVSVHLYECVTGVAENAEQFSLCYLNVSI